MIKHRVTYEVEEIKGSCPMYKKGDRLVMDSYGYTECVNVKESDAVCMRVLDNTWCHMVYQAGDDTLVDYMGGGVGECRIACSMPGEPYTPCGYVIFRIKRENLQQEGAI